RLLSFPVGLLCHIRRQSTVVFVRSQCAVISNHIVRDRLLRRGKAWISDFRHPFCFQTPEEALCRGVIPAIPSSAEALFHLITPEQLPKPQAGVLAPLIRMEHDS